MKKFIRAYCCIAFSLGVSALILYAYTGCADLQRPSPAAYASEAVNTDPSDTHFTKISSADSGISWVEPYPHVRPHSNAVGVFGSSDTFADIEHFTLDNTAFKIDKQYGLLEWNGIRTSGPHTVSITDKSGQVRYTLTIRAQPSQFLRDVFAAEAGEGAVLQRWWVNENDPSYFYVGGVDSSGQSRHYQVIFAHPLDNWGSVAKQSPDFDYAWLLSRTLNTMTIPDLDDVRVPNPKTHYGPVRTTDIVRALVAQQDTLCAPPDSVVNVTSDYNHSYVVTRASVVYDDSTGFSQRVRALNGSQHFLLLNKDQQRDCFEQAHLIEILPKVRPTTTPATNAVTRTDFPPRPRYPQNQYYLAFGEEFSSGTTVDTLYEQGYAIDVAYHISDGSYIPHSKFRATETRIDDPIVIKDGALHLGVGFRPRDDEDPADCEDPANTFHAERCMISSTVRNVAVPVFYRFGLLEIGFNRVSSAIVGTFIWLRSRNPFLPFNHTYGQFAGGNFAPYSYAYQGNHDTYSQRRPVFYNPPVSVGTSEHQAGRPTAPTAADYAWEMRVQGSELELLEVFRTPRLTHSADDPMNNATFWTVNHYGLYLPRFRNSDFPHWFYTVNLNALRPFRYAIESAPDGFKVWIDKVDGNGYQKLSDTRFQQAPGKRNGLVLACNDSRPHLATGLIPCGINHVPMQLQFDTGTGVIGLNPAASQNDIDDYLKPNGDYMEAIEKFEVLDQDLRFIEIDYIRLYKPNNNYSDIPRLYQ